MVAALFEALGKLDGAFLLGLQRHHAPWADVVLYNVSEAARAGRLWVVIGVMLASVRARRARAVWQLLLALGLSSLLTNVVAKPLVDRPRPFHTYAEIRVVGPKPASSSFPSGHTSNAVAAAYTLARVAPAGRSLFWTLAVIVAFSRVYLGVHYPLDVVAGALIGLAAAFIVTGGNRQVP